MSYDNTITEPEKHVLDCEHRAGFEAGMAMRGECKFKNFVYHDEFYSKCNQCKYTYEREFVIDNDFNYCPHCGAKITEVEK